METTMTSYECDTCGTRYTSPSAMMWCCVSEDKYGYKKEQA